MTRFTRDAARAASEGFLDALEHRLLTTAGVNVRFPAHLQPPTRARPVTVVGGIEAHDRRTDASPLLGYQVPRDHMGVIRSWAIGVNYFEDVFTNGDDTWNSIANGRFEFRKNGVPYPLLNPSGTILNPAAVNTSGTPTALVNEASDPTAAAAGGSCTAHLNDNPFGLHKTNQTYVLLDGDRNDTFTLHYLGVNAGGLVQVRMYARLQGWIWPKSDDPRS